MELWDGTWFAYWWPWESMWLASILSWLRNQRWASFSYPWMIWATAARSSWMSWSATPSHGNNSMLDAAEMNVVSCFIQCSMYKRQIRLVQQHRPRLVCWKSRRQEEDRLWCASLINKHLHPGELLTLCREGTTQTLSAQGCDLLCQLQQHRWGRREVTAKSLREKVVGFCYSQHWSECATFECWWWCHRGAAPKTLKVSPAEPLGFIRGHHQFLAVLAMLEFCACFWRLSA